MIGLDLEDNVDQELPRLAHPLGDPVRDPPRARLPRPRDFDIEEFRGRAEWQFGDIAGEARIEVAPDTAWWVHARVRRRRGTASRTTSS